MTCAMTSPPIRARFGLTQAAASRRLALEGANVLDEPRSRRLMTILIGTLREPMFLLFAAAVGLCLAVGEGERPGARGRHIVGRVARTMAAVCFTTPATLAPQSCVKRTVKRA
jgi:hypothetical protein